MGMKLNKIVITKLPRKQQGSYFVVKKLYRVPNERQCIIITDRNYIKRLSGT